MKTCVGVEVWFHQSSPRYHLEVCGYLHAEADVPPWKEPRCPLDSVDPQRRSGRCGEDKHVPARNRTPNTQPVVIHTELSRLVVKSVLPVLS
jgi:hypothetical protein